MQIFDLFYFSTMEKVVITGGSGLIGVSLTHLLIREGYEVVHLTRDKNSLCGVRTYLWDTKRNYIEEGALDNASHVIHLAGSSIAGGKWTEERKRSIINSRTKTAALLFRKVQEKKIQLKSFISASGISYYGTLTSDQIFTENDLPATDSKKDFASRCVLEWENEVDRFSLITRVVKLRTGIVLDFHGGALQKIYGPMQWGMGAALGNGKQWMPWIHIEDICRMYLFALKNNIEGSFNAVAPTHISNKGFVQILATITKHRLLFPNVPIFLLRMMFGEMANIVLEGSRVSSEKIEQVGFKFEFPELKEALINLNKHQ